MDIAQREEIKRIAREVLLEHFSQRATVNCPVCRERNKTVPLVKIDVGASGEKECPECKNTITFIRMYNGQVKAWNVKPAKVEVFRKRD